MDVVEALGQMAEDELRVGALGEDIQEIRRGDEVETGEGDTLGLEVVLEGDERYEGGQNYG